MKNFQKFTWLLFLFVSSYSLAQTGVTVTFYNGTTQGFNVTTAGKLYFASDNLYVKLNGTTAPTTIPVSIIQKITFGATLSTTTFGENENNLVLYPNPSSEVFRIQSNIDETLKIKIYSLQGQLVHQGNYQTNEDINVSDLASGIYLVQVNGLTIKFSKK